ncbi:MAG TPA: GNAT family N-acetyltransferase [Acidimicrobiales bacterium]|nr:GNAT family N-acetyltransferase [Acidimicrobiales bacterium]
MVVRERVDVDLDRCVAIAVLVHDLDGYPPYLPTDLRAFVAAPDAYGAWVVEKAGEIVGHVALHRGSSPAVLAVAGEALSRPVDRLGVVARLFVDPSARRSGVGETLLDVASRQAVARGLWPVLDVATQLEGAIRLYERCGWSRAGAVTVRLGDRFTLDEFVYLGPHRPEDDPTPER